MAAVKGGPRRTVVDVKTKAVQRAAGGGRLVDEPEQPAAVVVGGRWRVEGRGAV